MVSEFFDGERSDAHAAFQQWREDNPVGYLINCKTSRLGRLHRTGCLHLGNTEFQVEDGFGSLTQQRKVCSADRRSLVEWAQKHGVDLKPCNDCAP